MPHANRFAKNERLLVRINQLPTHSFVGFSLLFNGASGSTVARAPTLIILLQDFVSFDSRLIGFFPAAFSFAFNAESSVVLSALHFCSDASSMPLSLV